MERNRSLRIAWGAYVPTYLGKFLVQWDGLFHERVELHLGYSLWGLTLAADGEGAEHDPDGLPSTLAFKSCDETQTFLQLGHSPTEFQWFCPTSMRLQSPTYTTHGGQRAEAELVIEHRLFNTTRAPLIPGVEELVMVLPLHIARMQEHYSDLFDSLLNTSRSQGTEEAVDLAYRFIAAATAQLQRLDGRPAWLLPDALAEVRGEACAATLLVLLQDPLLTRWLPKAVLERLAPPDSAGAAPRHTEMIRATMREGYFEASSFTARALSLRTRFYGVLVPVVAGLAIILAGPVSCLKRHANRRRQPSRMASAIEPSAGTDSARPNIDYSQYRRLPAAHDLHSLEMKSVKTLEMLDDAAEDAARDTPGDAADGCSTQLKVLAVAVHWTTITVICVMGLYPFERGYWGDITCFSNFPWERHFCVVLLFAAVRAVDMATFVLLPTPPPGRHPDKKSCWRFCIGGGIAATASFANVWYDLVCARVAYECKFVLWPFMACAWGAFALGWYFWAPLRFLLKLCSPKMMFILANLDMSASCLQFHEISGRDVRWLGKTFMLRLLFLNAPMVMLELIMAVNRGLDHMIATALLFACLSVLFNSVSISKMVLVMGTPSELEAYAKYCLREQLANAVQEGRLGDVRALLARASTLRLRDDVVLTAEGRLQQDVQAEEVSRFTLEERLEEHIKGQTLQLASTRCSSVARHTMQLHATAVTCLRVLADGQGGAMIAIVDRGVAKRMQTQSLDCGALRQVLEGATPNIRRGEILFHDILDIASSHSATDRWSTAQVTRLEASLRDEKLSVGGCEALHKQPQDGAIVLDHGGDVLEAAVMLKHEQQRYFLRKVDGTNVGTRHTAAFSTAIWLGQQATLGVVFVRSDSGGMHCFFGGGEDKPPQALYLASSQIHHSG